MGYTTFRSRKKLMFHVRYFRKSISFCKCFLWRIFSPFFPLCETFTDFHNCRKRCQHTQNTQNGPKNTIPKASPFVCARKNIFDDERQCLHGKKGRRRINFHEGFCVKKFIFFFSQNDSLFSGPNRSHANGPRLEKVCDECCNKCHGLCQTWKLKKILC